MVNLATYQDVEARLGTKFDTCHQAQVTLLLGDASRLIRSYTKQSFTFTEDDEIILRPIGEFIRLPQSPVVDVTSVIAMSGYAGLPEFPLSAWIFDGIDKITIFGGNGQVVNYPEWWYDYEGANTYKVTYSHGYPDGEIPEDVIAVCCGMVMRVVTSPSQVGGMVSERIGQYFYQLQQNQGSAGASVRLSADDKSSLSPYRRSATTIQTSVV